MSFERLTGRLLRIGVAAVLLGGGAALAGYFHDPRAFLGAWLAAFYFWLSMPLGALALLLIWDLTGGRWEALARRPLNAMAATMPLFIILFLPVIAGLDQLYPWARTASGLALHNRWYLNPRFFFLRAAVCFVIWNALALWRLRRGPGTAERPGRPQWLSALGLMLLLYTMTCAGIDWIMSTEPDWFSSVYGMIVCSAQAAASLALLLVLIVLEHPVRAPREHPFSQQLAALVTILVAVVIFWGYASFSQWLIMWEENLRTDIRWFMERRQDPWPGVLYAVIIGYLVIPFVTLVWSPTKKMPHLVGAVCILLLLAGALHVWWLLLPGLHTGGICWIHPAALVGVGGLWTIALAAALRWMEDPLLRRPCAERLIHG